MRRLVSFECAAHRAREDQGRSEQSRREQEQSYQAQRVATSLLPATDLRGFEPSATFKGGRSGWVFKTGVAGLGYYKDGFEPSATFQGSRNGWHFKTGSEGLGYYKDRRYPPQPAGMWGAQISSSAVRAQGSPAGMLGAQISYAQKR